MNVQDIGHTVIASAAGGFLSELLAIPFCTTKTVFVTNAKFTYLSHAFLDIYNTRGLLGFYQATGPAIIAQIVASSSKFSIYTICKSYRETKDNDILNNSLNGIIGGVTGGIIAHPIDVWKIHKQRNEPLNIKERGIKILGNGYSQTLIKNISLNSMLYPLNDFYQSCGLTQLQSQITGTPISQSMMPTVLSQVATAITTTTILYPIEFIRTNKMAATRTDFGWNIRRYYKGIGVQYPLNILRFITQMQTFYFVKHLLK
jgi:hypothetical protein